MPKYFEVESQSEYMIELNCVENIEDVADDFLTEEEVKALGLSTYGSTQYFSDKIKAALIEVKQSIKPGKKSAIIKDELLIEALKDNYRSVGYYLENTRRVGNRLFYYPQGTGKIQTVPSYRNWKKLVGDAFNHMNDDDQYDTYIDINLPNSNRVKTINLIKKVYTWEDMVAYWDNKEYYVPEADEIEWMKMMWEDSETIPLPK